MSLSVYNTNVTDFLLDGKKPDRIALRLVDKAHSYGELQCTAAGIARYLVHLGGQKEDRVLLVSENSFFWVVAYLGALRAGLVCVPLPTDVSPQDLDGILQITEARMAFLQARFAIRNRSHFRGVHLITDRGVPNLPECASQRNIGETLSVVLSAKHSLPWVRPDDLAALMFTSGSIGRPRGVMVSHANIMANTESIIQYLRLTEDDRIMTVLPFHYCFGTSLLHTHLRVGGSVVIDLRFMYPETVLQRMLETECTGFAGVPSHFQILLRSSSLRKKDLPPFAIRSAGRRPPFTLLYSAAAGGIAGNADLYHVRSNRGHGATFVPRAGNARKEVGLHRQRDPGSKTLRAE